MYCKNCGNKRKNNEKYCLNCGEKLTNSTNKKLNNNGTVSLILGLVSFLFISYPLIAIIFSIISIIIGKKHKKETGNNSDGPIIATISLSLSIIYIILTIVYTITFNNYNETNYLEQILNKYNNNYFEYNEDYFDEYKNSKESFNISGYSWLGIDNSILYLNNNYKYNWYQNDQEHNNNFHSGNYEFYTGEEAINYISTNLPEYGLTEKKQRNIIENNNYEIKDYYILILNCNKSIINNQEQNMNNTIYYYGFYDQNLNQLNLTNITTNVSAQFNLKEKIVKIDI